MWLSEQKPAMLAYKLKFILLPQLIATLNNYACLLLPLANDKWSASLEWFFQLCKSIAGEMVSNGGLKFGSGDLISLWQSAHICLSLVVEYWPFVGACGHHRHSKLYHCVILLLYFSLRHHPPHPCVPPTYPFIYFGPLLMNSMKRLSKWAKISHYLLAKLVIQKLIDN